MLRPVLHPDYRRAQWVAIILPALSLGGFEFLRHSLLEGRIGKLEGNLLSALLVALWGALYSRMLIRLVEDAHRDLAAAREQTAVLAERDRIARAMHDGLSQSLFFMNVKLRDAVAAAGRDEGPEVHTALQQVQAALGDAYGTLRQAIADLRRHPAQPDDLAPAVAECLRSFSARSGIATEFDQCSAAPNLTGRRQEHLLAILQEALNNVQKHAAARRVVVRLDQRGAGLALVVEDDGRGLPDPAPGGTFGIPMMQERAALLGGHLQLRRGAGGGTVVELLAPAAEVEA